MQTYSDYETFFKDGTLSDMITYAAQGFNGKSLNELMAMRGRLIDLALHDPDPYYGDRVTAASWARSIESLIVEFCLVGHPQLSARYFAARKIGEDCSTKFGYGSVGYFAKWHPNRVAARIFSADNDPDNQAHREQQGLLMDIAFGHRDMSSIGATWPTE